MTPGDLVAVRGGADGARYASVLATSRHKRTYDRTDARNDLDRAYLDEGDTLDTTATVVWYLHTRKVQEHGCLGSDCEPGSWCEDGDGQAWVRVLCGAPLTVLDEGET